MSRFILFIFLICFTFPAAFAYQNQVYSLRGFPNLREGQLGVQELESHFAQIDIWSSQAYYITTKGLIGGTINPQMQQSANQHHIQIMPLVTNNNYDPNQSHIFLTDNNAQLRAIQAILQVCQQNHYAGVQIDFEGMRAIDRDNFTQFYQTLAQTLHQNHFKIAIAIIPRLNDAPPASDFLLGRYNYLSGVYDYKALGESSDFVTLMTYDQHGSATTPGPAAGITWTKSIIQYALHTIPPNKIFLGIPLYSRLWYTGKIDNSIRVRSTSLGFQDMTALLKNNQTPLLWDKTDQIPYAIFTRHYLYTYIFAENAASLKAKIALVKKYKLAGVSLWCLGDEDPKIWEILAKRH